MLPLNFKSFNLIQLMLFNCERESEKKITISGSFYLLFFILSAARAILLSSSSELLNTKKTSY